MREFTTTNPALAEQTWEAVWGMNDRKIWEGRENLGSLLLHKGPFVTSSDLDCLNLGTLACHGLPGQHGTVQPQEPETTNGQKSGRNSNCNTLMRGA